MIQTNLLQAELYKIFVMIKRNMFRLFDMTLYPLSLFFSIVLFLKFVSPTPEIMSMVITGLIGWRAVYHFHIEMNIAYMDEYWSKNTAQVLASPQRFIELVVGSVLSASIKFLVVLLQYLTLAFLFFDFQIFDIFKFITGVSFLCFCGIILGMITYSFVILYKHDAITFAFIVPNLVVMISGVYYPMSIFPQAFIKFAHILPTFYGFELLKSMTGLGTTNYLGMVITGVLWFIVAVILLRFSVKKARKNGSLCNFN